MKTSILSRLSKKSADLLAVIGKLAEAKGMKAYLVGGPVRDLLLEHSQVDLDITVEGNGMRLAECLAQDLGGRAQSYPAFKTSTVRLAAHTIDFATARKETYARGGAFPAVVPSSIKEDLLRRDFTINAMAVAINAEDWGKIIDPCGGRTDLKAKRIRVLHAKSFIDDPTRILRAARFKARLGFHMEAKTLKLLKSAVAAKVLDSIKPQRYLKDFNKILKEKKSAHAIKCLKEWKALRSI